MSVDAKTGKIIQNRVYDKINYQTSFTDFNTFVEYCRFIKSIEPVNGKDVNRLCGKKRSEFTPSWKNDKSDSHAKISLLQYGLIEEKDGSNYVLSTLGEKFISMFDENNEIIAPRDQFLETAFEMMDAWHQKGNGFDIHPGRMILKLMLEKELHGYFTDQDLARICNDTTNRLDEQYDEIKQKVIDFRESGLIYTREEKKKTYTLLTGYANNWNIFELDEKSDNTIKIVRLCEDYKKTVLDRLQVASTERVLSDDEMKSLVKDIDDLEEKVKSWEQSYGIDGRIITTHATRVSQVQDAFRNRLLKKHNHKCMLCDIKNHDLLIASHIKRDADCESIEEKIDVENGFLLCANHDKLFDKYLITFNFIDGKISISKSLTKTEKELMQLDENYVLDDEYLTDNRRNYLMYHNEIFEKKESERSGSGE